MSLKTSKKSHGLGKGISSLLGNFDIENTEEILDELERRKNSAVETLMSESKGKKIIPQNAQDDPAVSIPAEERKTEGQVINVHIDDVRMNPDQPRKSFDEASLNELAQSVQRQGILQPLLVEEYAPGKYSIIAGERRYRAARIAGLDYVPVLVKNFNEIQRIEVALIENIQREDLNPVDEAAAYQFLIQTTGMTQEDIAKRVGKNSSTITNSLRLLQRPTPGHARAILSCVNPSDRIVLRNRIVDKDLSVRAAEAEAEALNQGKKLILRKKKGAKDKDPDIQSVEDKFLDAFGTKVEVKGSLKRGKLVIAFKTGRELERIYSLLRDDSLFEEE